MKVACILGDVHGILGYIGNFEIMKWSGQEEALGKYFLNNTIFFNSVVDHEIAKTLLFDSI